MEEHGGLVENGEEELLAARRMLAEELREEARLLSLEEEDPQSQWTDYAESRKSETEIVIIGIQASTDDYALASILGGGLKVRNITMTGTETFVSYHHARDAAEALTTASLAITNAGGSETVVKKARYKKDLHEHEGNPDGPQPRYKPYPTHVSGITGRWTDWGHGDDDADSGTGVWTDWSKGERQWVTRESTQRCNTINTSTGASSSRTSTEEVSGYADPDDGRSKKRPRGL
jgi:hypothetical protein